MNRYCDGVKRRDLLKAGLLGGFGLSLADLLRLEATGRAGDNAKGKNAIFLFLDGGQSHMDSWDPKPDGGEAAGEFKPIATNLPGFQVCEHMPRLAKLADKYAVLRGVHDAIPVHGRGMSFVRSGNRPRASITYPDIGSVIAKAFEEGNVPRLAAATAALAVTLVLINRVLWKPLQRLAVRRFAMNR